MLRWRLLLGTVLVGGLAGLLWLDAQARWPGIWLLPPALILVALASGELLSLLQAQGLHPDPRLAHGGTLLLVAANLGSLYVGQGSPAALAWPAGALGAVVLLAWIGEVYRYRGDDRPVERLAATLLSVMYLGWTFSFLVQLRWLGMDNSADPSSAGASWGLAPLVSLLVAVKLGDTGAYAVGRLFGRRKLAPRLSPGKTWEGLAGGLAASVLGAWLVLGWLLPPAGQPVSLGSAAVYGLLVGLAGVLGDLAESLLKRQAGRKDSSLWMPGFGGVLDLIDSLLLAAPVAWLCWVGSVVGSGR